MRKFIVGVALAFLVGCAGLTVNTTAGIAYQAATAAAQASTAKLRARKITVEEDQANQAKIAQIVLAMDAAVATKNAQALNTAKADADTAKAQIEAK